MLVSVNLDEIIVNTLRDVNCSNLAKEYIRSVFKKPEPISDSIVLKFLDARSKSDFSLYQKIGDWSLFCLSFDFLPQDASVLQHIGAQSYHACFSLLKNEWQIFYELGSNIEKIPYQTKNSFALQMLKTEC